MGDLHASMEDRDASVCGLTTQDTASTPSSLFDPSTPQGSEDLDADYFSKEEPRLSFAEQRNSTFPVRFDDLLAQTKDQDQIHQGIAKSIIDESRSSHCDPLHERAAGSCDRGSVSDFEDEIRQAPEEAEGSRPSSASHSQYNQMNQESQSSTDVRSISSEELQEQTIEQQQRQQEEHGEDEDDIEAIRGENKGTNSYCRQIKESLQHQGVGDETIDMAPISQDRHHSVEPCQGNEDDEDEDVRPPSRRKRRRMSSDTTETLTRKKIRTPSAVAQAQTRTLGTYLRVHHPMRNQF